jgi:hypothetical protein
MLDSDLRKRLVEHYEWDRAAGFIEVRTANVLTEKPHSNPPQRWKRVLKQGTTAIDDLILLAETLPEDKRAELFTPERVTRLFNAILGNSLINNITTKQYYINEEKNKKANEEPDAEKRSALLELYNRQANDLGLKYYPSLQNNLRIAEIAANISSLGLAHCSRQYELIESDIVLQRPLIDVLSNARQITQSILAKMQQTHSNSNSNNLDR